MTFTSQDPGCQPCGHGLISQDTGRYVRKLIEPEEDCRGQYYKKEKQIALPYSQPLESVDEDHEFLTSTGRADPYFAKEPSVARSVSCWLDSDRLALVSDQHVPALRARSPLSALHPGSHHPYEIYVSTARHMQQLVRAAAQRCVA